MKVLLTLGAVVLAFGLVSPARAQIAPCGIPYQQSSLTPTGHAVLVPPSQPLILVNPFFINQMQAVYGVGNQMLHYLLQHECGHHMLGHVAMSSTDPYSTMWITAHIELQADCYAAKQLYAVGDAASLQTAVLFWANSGFAPTGPNYPTGYQRAQMLQQCFAP